MAYDTEKVKSGRKPYNVIEIDLDYCAEAFGVAPCTGVGEACRNTRKTCKDSANYNRSARTYRFGDAHGALPPGLGVFPCIVPNSIRKTPVRINPGKGIGVRGTLSFTLQDFTHHDRAQDDYTSTRSSAAQGTFLGRLLARNPYYVGRPIRLLTGFIAETFSWSDFETRHYVIEDISGPDSRGRVTVTAKTILKVLDDDRTKIPAPSEGVLSAGITDTATSLTLSPSGIGTDYGSSGTVRIGSEIMTFSGRSTDTLTGLTRAQWGTTADAHDADDTVQLCKTYSSINCVNVAYDLLVTEGPLSASQVPFNDNPGTPDEWDDEKADWLSGINITAIISEPTGVNSLIGSLGEECGFYVWEDEVNNLIKLKANAPLKGGATPTLFTDDDFVENSVRVDSNQKGRISRLYYYYGMIDYSERPDTENYRYLSLFTAASRETDDFYGSERIKELKSFWMTDANATAIGAIGTRLINRFADPPPIVTFMVDISADVEHGQLIDVQTHAIQGLDGSPQTLRFEIIQIAPKTLGHNQEVKALGSIWIGTYAFIGPDTLNAWASESDANRAAYAFISDDDGLMTDGTTPGYQII